VKLAQSEMSGQIHPGCISPGESFRNPLSRRLGCFRAGLVGLVNRKIFCPCQKKLCNLKHSHHTYRSADKFLARPTSWFISFDGENTSFDASLVTHIKVKQSRNRPGVAQRVPGGLGFQIFMTFGTWRWWGRQPQAPAAFTPRNVPAAHFH